MGQKTPLYDQHLQLNAKIVDFGGWDMPLHYGSQVEEHHAVRGDAGMFDVSHMAVLDLEGVRVREFLRQLLANDVARLTSTGKALYTCMLRDDGGVIDDLIVYLLGDFSYRLVVNAGTREKDLEWILPRASAFDVTVAERCDLAVLAIQGPNARFRTAQLLPPDQRDAALALRAFSGAMFGRWFLARTGYTGEDGFELMLPSADAAGAWQQLLAEGVKPVGLGARDTLRLEAGMSLYGNDLDEAHDPLQSGLEWTVAFDPADRSFIGRAALERAQRLPHALLVGLLLEERGVLRAHQKVFTISNEPVGSAGEITSGTFSPTLTRSIALARVPHSVGSTVEVDIRGKRLIARVVRPPFVRHGKTLINI